MTMDLDNADWYAPEAATFGDRLAAAREQAGLDQKELARRLGVRSNTIRKWENDISEPRANRLSIMAGLLNVSMMWLINGKGEGMDAPPETIDGAQDMRDILVEMGQLRSELLERCEKMGRLEKRLRHMMLEGKR